MDASAAVPGEEVSARPTVVVITGGDAPHPATAAHLPADALVVAADSGADHARALGLAVDVLVGDLDSISPAASAAAGETLAASPDKDATDLELALAVAAERAPRDAPIVVVAGRGGRLDHDATTLATLAGPFTRGHSAEAWLGAAHVLVARDEVATSVRPGELVSLIPVHGPARGVSTTGLRWPLIDATLEAGTTWGLSNEAIETRVTVRVTEGVVLVVRPHALTPDADGSPAPERPASEPTAPLTPPLTPLLTTSPPAEPTRDEESPS